MGLENFYQGEEVSARKLNELVCAINGLCSTMQALQREQTVAGLGQNDRPRMLGRARDEDCTEPSPYADKKYDMCFVHDTIEAYVPPWGVVGVTRMEWDPDLCYCVAKRYYYIASGVWKEGQARPAGVWCVEGHEISDSSDGLAGKWVGPPWLGGWIEEPADTTRHYLFATNEGKLVLRSTMTYDWRYERLLADLSTWTTPNCNVVRTIARNGCTEQIFFPLQYWTGDICQPKARWEQGGMYSVQMNPRTGRVNICGGIAMIEGPMAAGGNKYFDYATQTTRTERIEVEGSGSYWQVPGHSSQIPAARSGYKQYLYLGFDAAEGAFWWFWRTDTIAYEKKDIPIFTWSISTTSEVGYCQTYVICTTWQTTHCNYGTWRMAVPMGVAYMGECGYVCVAVAQHVPQFRARAIVNLQNAGLICSTGNDWDCEGYKTPCGCQAAWATDEAAVCELVGCYNGLQLDVLREAYVSWIPVCKEE